jgi:hypothetical protein
LPDSLSEANLKDKKFTEKSLLKDAFRETLGKELLKKSPKKNIRNRDGDIKKKLIKEPFRPEFMKLAN